MLSEPSTGNRTTLSRQKASHQPEEDDEEDYRNQEVNYDNSNGGSLDTAEVDADSELDQAIERSLQDMVNCEDSLECMLKRLKIDSQNLKDLMFVLKRRAALEKEYAEGMYKLASAMDDVKIKDDHYMEPSFGSIWEGIRSSTGGIATDRLMVSKAYNDIHDELSTAHKNVERSKKQIKEAGLKHQKQLNDVENQVEKAKAKYEASASDLEKFRSQTPGFKQEEHHGLRGLTGIFQKKKSEEDFWIRAQASRDNYEVLIKEFFDAKQEYFHVSLPHLLTSLKEADEEASLAINAMVLRFVDEFQKTSDKEANNCKNLKVSAGQFDLKKDLHDYLGRFLSQAASLPPSKSDDSLQTYKIFGVDLGTLAMRDARDVPVVVTKCINTIELVGMDSNGIYRAHGNAAKVGQLKKLFETTKGAAFDGSTFDAYDYASVLKSFFKELPDPLMTQKLYSPFLKAAKIENEKQKLLRIHELVNELPDANYATLKVLAGHLVRVSSYQESNHMNIHNLAVALASSLMTGSKNSGDDVFYHVVVLETILESYTEIFD